MKTQVLRVAGKPPEDDVFLRAAAVLRAGGLVAFPTETVYGLGANALCADSVNRIFTAKGRPAHNPLIVHVAGVAGAARVAAGWPANAALLAERFWPGPLTLVLPKHADVPGVVTGGGPTVAVRAPAHPAAQALLRAAGLPIAAPSANRSNGLSPTQAEHVRRGLEGRIEMILDGGPTPGGIESTIIDLTSDPPRLLRPGLITPAEIEAVVGPIQRSAPTPHAEGPLPSPGMLQRHYSPRAPLECVHAGGARLADQWLRAGLRVGWLRRAPGPPPHPPTHAAPGLVVIDMPPDAPPYAARLFAALHELDDAGVDRIVVDAPPDSDAWLGVRDRLRRASAPTPR
ncbi:Threonylcarbamoyl-AMP synthase [Pirellulimonas nuda]|uniref:Threonylcarbamoyl-AMP synthase n=1 Tax=Pirellulimonas nuda TaxID=2528009 RepID=A0A518DEB4_9BACT|nr:L-threonylcarbamoyladenylate synthase [Pirellulimonas nuda]QDU89819.1 Threonylcarbamoyl-AMP synthase [Pirellulimonas nuda]